MNLADFETWARAAIVSEKAKGFKLYDGEWGIPIPIIGVDTEYTQYEINCGCLQTILVKAKGGNEAALRLFDPRELFITDEVSDSILIEDIITAEVLEITPLQASSLRCGFDSPFISEMRGLDDAEWYRLGAKFRIEFPYVRAIPAPKGQ